MLVSVGKAPQPGEQGTIFIVVLAVIALMSSVIMLGIGPFHVRDDQDSILQTSRKQEFLIRELASYVQRVNALPCPADPAVDPASRDFGFARKSCNVETATGLIPFRTLGLSEHDARDGWGRFMTYKISPVLANTNAGNHIFMRCRRWPWFDGNPSDHMTNLLPQKARFCCPPDDGAFPPNTDLKVFPTADSIKPGITMNRIGRKADPSYYDDINKPVNIGPQGALAPVPEAAGTEEMFAVALISHGRNGIGTWLANGKPDRMAGTASADEAVNAGNDLTVVSRPVNLARGPDYFDDVVLWRTQIRLMGELNNASCYEPWR